MSKIIERIEREVGVPGLVSLLAERLEPTDLQSILLEVYRLRAGQRQPSAVLSDYQTNRFVRPSALSPLRLHEWERTALSELPPEFEPLALSPVCPLGTNSVMASVDQNWAVSTSRNTEVVSDPTNVLALECALRRRQLLRAQPKSTDRVHLAASHRLLRAQRYDDPSLVPHFSLFALCSAGRDEGNLQFELAALSLHIRFYLRSLRAFLGPTVPLRLSVSDFSPQAHHPLISSRLLAPIRDEFPGLTCIFDRQRTSGRGYYLDLCFHIHARAASDDWLELTDGGSVDWTQKLLSNSKERLVISGIGSERVFSEFSSITPQDEDQADLQVLVAYATKYGATAEIAARIGQVLRDAGLGADVLPVDRVGDLTPYQAVVLGSAVYVGQWREEAATFLAANENKLAQRALWLFSSGPMGEGDPVQLMRGWRFPEAQQPIADRLHPRDIAVFHGLMDLNNLSVAERLIARALRTPVGDFRDWDAITTWATAVADALKEVTE